MSNIIRTTIGKPGQHDRKRTVATLPQRVGHGWDAAAGPSQFRLYVHQPGAHYTLGMSAEEVASVLQAFAPLLGFDLVKREEGEE